VGERALRIVVSDDGEWYAIYKTIGALRLLCLSRVGIVRYLIYKLTLLKWAIIECCKQGIS
jgi:hypothetical protein